MSDSGSDLPPQDYWDSIPKWTLNSTNRRFDILSDDISGRLPVTRLEHWKEIGSLLEDPFFNRSETTFIFRGHRRFDWSLTPTLGWLADNAIVTDGMAMQQLERFRLAIRGRIQDRALLEQVHDGQQCDELWAVGQHHGLMTPLLDWTHSPYVALFFAFAKPDASGEKSNPYRAIYILNKTFVADDDLCSDIRILEPRKDDHGRLVNQAGLFTFSPDDATIENKLLDVLSDPEYPDDELREASEEAQAEILASYICKVYIRNIDRDECLLHLRRMNVHHASLFPDLLGASEYCNLLAEEARSTMGRRHAAPVIKNMGNAAPIASGLPASKPPRAEIISTNQIYGFEVILESFAKEKSKEQIKRIALDLQDSLAKEKAFDWKDRASLHARLRVTAKMVLRKAGFAKYQTEQIARELVEHMVSVE